MDNSNKGKSIIEIGGHPFNRVENGLDEKQVVPFIEELIEERDSLRKRQEHLSTLTRAFETIISEADDKAKEIKREAEEQAQNNAKAIIAKAEEEARVFLEDRKVAVETMAQDEISAMRSQAEKELQALLNKVVGEIQSQLKNIGQELSSGILRQAETTRKQVETFEEDFERKLSALESINNQAHIEEEIKVDATIASVAPETATLAENAVPQADTEVEPETLDVEPNVDNNKVWTELEILPPRDIDSIERIKAKLDEADGIDFVKLLHLPDKTVIEVSMNKPMDLVEVISKLPEVEQVEKVIKGNQMKLVLLLTAKSKLQYSREEINRKANILASHI